MTRDPVGNACARSIMLGMHEVESVAALESMERPGCLLCQFLFGLSFVVGAICFMAQTRDVFRYGGLASLHFALVGLVFFLFGLTVAWSTVAQYRKVRTFGKARARLDRLAVTPGGSFTFQFEMPCRTTVEPRRVGVYFVWRERVTFPHSGDTSTERFDRVIDQTVCPAQVYGPDNPLRVEQIFRVPAADPGLRHPLRARDHDVQTAWLVKVGIELCKWQDVWREYPINVEGTLAPSEPPPPDRFDVYLTSQPMTKMTRVMSVMRELMPHLDSTQIPHLARYMPVLVLENVSALEAQDAARRLEEAGGTAQVQPAGTN